MIKKYKLGSFRVASSTVIDYEACLNEEQLEAVTAGEGPILVIAGAGSGKTRTITYRVAWLLDCGVSPERIMLVTFTNKAAKDMLHRVEHLLSSQARGILGGTFHHIGNIILRHYAHLLGYENNYTIMDREDSIDLLDACITDLVNPKEKRFPTSQVLSDINSLALNMERSVENIVQHKYPFLMEEIDNINKVLRRYKERKKQLNLMDFDDLLFNWKKLFVEYPEIKTIYSDRFLYILVDEYQDTNKLQGEIIDLMAFLHRNIMVVGDDSQSIYSFRGANFTNIISFPERYPDTKIFKLETNYRSTPPILHLTNCIISANKKQFPKTLRPVKRGDFKPAVVPLRDVNQQAEFVAQRILELRDEGKSLGEIAVLYRSHYHSMEVQMELTRRGIPFVVRSGLRFFERAHIKDVTAYLKVMVNSKDELSWKRIFKMLKGVGNVTADRLWKDLMSSGDPLGRIESGGIKRVFPRKVPPEWAGFVENIKFLQDESFQRNPSGMIHFILQHGYEDYLKSKYPDYEERIEDLNQLASFARGYSSLRHFLSELALLGSVESETVVVGGEEDECVILSTVHQAKGLEWSVVFVIWLADGRFPAAKALRYPDGLEEERRLLYVATTRAKEELYLCYPIIAGNWRQAVLMKPSRFLKDIDETIYDKWIIDEEIERLLERLEEMGGLS
ncbi:ATP-dependent helicase [Candidatus Aerophobetes bacterium]|nr:ATP-dependent helicase [Candidatus Aerophobetes bacterium]